MIEGRYALSVGRPDLPAPKGWHWTKLTDVARLETGHTPSRKHPEYWGGDIPWIGIKDAASCHGRKIERTLECVTPLGIENSAARVLPRNTVCLSRTASIGYVVVMDNDMATSQDFVDWVCGDRLHPLYLKYILLAEQESLFRFAHGTTHQTIYFPEVKALHALLPERDEQDRIVGVLGSLDDKIDLNRRMNATLEATARAIFKAWFVDFEALPVEAGRREPVAMVAETAADYGRPLDRSPGRTLPTGWEAAGLDQVAEYRNGLALQKFPAVDGQPRLPVIKIAQMRTGSPSADEFVDGGLDAAFVVEDGDVLFSWSGSLAVVIWTGGRGALNQHLFKVTSNRTPKWFYLLWTKHHLSAFQEIAANKATTMGHIQRHHLSEARVLVPPAGVMRRMGEVLGPIVEEQVRLGVETRTLEATRDALLPKLLSGQLRVLDLEEPSRA